MSCRSGSGWRWAIVALPWLLGSCAVPLARSCPQCRSLVLGVRPAVPQGTQTVYLLVPGLLGYGWEWDAAQAEFARLPDTVTLVWSWDPWRSLAQSGDDLTRHIEYLARRLPASVQRLVVVGHSAAGLLLLWASSRVQVPDKLGLTMVSIGAPLAGQGFNPWCGYDDRRTPLPIALGSKFSLWPSPAAGVKLIVFATGPRDPVMASHFGHDPGDRAVLPKEADIIALPSSLDHNLALGEIAKQLRQQELTARQSTAGKPTWPTAAP